MLPIPRESREEKLTETHHHQLVRLVLWRVPLRFPLEKGACTKWYFIQYPQHQWVFFSFALTICPFQARKRKTRRVGNQIDGETHMRNLKLKTHKISTDILSCTNYWQLKDERGISAHTKKKKQRQRFSRQVCHPFPFFPLHNRFWFGFFFLCPSDVYMYVHTIYIYIYMHIKRQLVVIKLYTKAVESFLFRWCHCRFFIFGIASFCKTVRFVRLDAELMMQWQLMHTTQSAFSIYDIYAQLVSLFAVWRFSWRSIPRSPPIFPLIW